MEYNLPKDPVILLSYINTQLRDHYTSFEDLCVALNVSGEEITEKIAGLNYAYDAGVNQFI